MSRLTKICTVIICCAVLALGLAGCTNIENETGYQTTDDSIIFVHVDKETGVNYIVLYTGHGTGGICPRYNADGSLYVGGTE